MIINICFFHQQTKILFLAAIQSILHDLLLQEFKDGAEPVDLIPLLFFHEDRLFDMLDPPFIVPVPGLWGFGKGVGLASDLLPIKEDPSFLELKN